MVLCSFKIVINILEMVKVRNLNVQDKPDNLGRIITSAVIKYFQNKSMHTLIDDRSIVEFFRNNMILVSV